MAGSRLALRARGAHVGPRVEVLGVDLVGGRNEQHVDTGSLSDARVALLVAWIAPEIFVCAELGRVDEQRNEDDVTFASGGAKQRNVAVVERAHRRYEP